MMMMDNNNESQGIQATQPQQNEEIIIEEDNEVITWGRLVSNHPESRHIDLIDQDIYFGRNPKKCKVVLHDPTVSGVHCRIFREEQKKANAQSVYITKITDTSSNGTFVKGNQLGKDKTTIIQNGDMVSFTSHKPMGSLSFTFLDLLNPLGDESSEEEISKHYFIQGTLGTGNFSVVKRCVHKDTGEAYAVKIIDKKKFWHVSKTRNQMESEVNILKKIKHQNIISIIEIFDTDRYLYIVLELATGGELFHMIKDKGRYMEPEAKETFRQILEAVSYLHNLNISHRDLKPENILISNTPTGETLIKVTDFGLAKIIGEKEYATTLCGTPLYVAPEVIKNCLYNKDNGGNNGYGKEVDAWSLGCILYILLSGSPPFSSDQSNQFNFKQIDKGLYNFDNPVWSTITDNAKELICKLLNVDPTKRISIRDALTHSWFTNELYRCNTVLTNFSPSSSSTNSISSTSTASTIKSPQRHHGVIQLPTSDVKPKNIPFSLINPHQSPNISKFQNLNFNSNSNNNGHHNNNNNSHSKSKSSSSSNNRATPKLTFAQPSPPTPMMMMNSPQPPLISSNKRITSPMSSSTIFSNANNLMNQFNIQSNQINDKRILNSTSTSTSTTPILKSSHDDLKKRKETSSTSTTTSPLIDITGGNSNGSSNSSCNGKPPPKRLKGL